MGHRCCHPWQQQGLLSLAHPLPGKVAQPWACLCTLHSLESKHTVAWLMGHAVRCECGFLCVRVQGHWVFHARYWLVAQLINYLLAVGGTQRFQVSLSVQGTGACAADAAVRVRTPHLRMHLHASSPPTCTPMLDALSAAACLL